MAAMRSWRLNAAAADVDASSFAVVDTAARATTNRRDEETTPGGAALRPALERRARTVVVVPTLGEANATGAPRERTPPRVACLPRHDTLASLDTRVISDDA
jgi:hypothetical protein